MHEDSLPANLLISEVPSAQSALHMPPPHIPRSFRTKRISTPAQPIFAVSIDAASISSFVAFIFSRDRSSSKAFACGVRIRPLFCTLTSNLLSPDRLPPNLWRTEDAGSASWSQSPAGVFKSCMWLSVFQLLFRSSLPSFHLNALYHSMIVYIISIRVNHHTISYGIFSSSDNSPVNRYKRGVQFDSENAIKY